jgi:hypothetical protein
VTSSTNRPIRVAVFATGAIGTLAIQSIVRRPDMELVGVWVHSDDKAGRDAGEITGGREIGITTTRNIEEILANRPQVAVYTATGPEQDAFNMPIYVQLLGAGVDVITVSSAWLMYPPAGDPVLTSQLSAAAQSGGSTLYCSGLEPGFMGDHLVALLSTLSDTVESVRTQEFFYYHTYENHFLMFDVFIRPADGRNTAYAARRNAIDDVGTRSALRCRRTGNENRAHPRDLLPTRNSARSRCGVRDDPGGDMRSTAHGNHRRRRRPRRHRDRTHQPHGTRPRT